MGNSASRPEIEGDIESGVADTSTSAPIKFGGIAKETDGTAVTTVSEDQRIEARFTRDGRMFVTEAHPYSLHTFTSYAAATTASALIAAPGAGLSLYIVDVHVESNTAASFMFLENTGAAVNKTKIRLNNPGSQERTFTPPLRLSANTNFGVTTDATATSVYVSGFIAP